MFCFQTRTFPESIRWSVSQARIKEVKTTIKRIEKWNNIKVNPKIVETLVSLSSFSILLKFKFKFIKKKGTQRYMQKQNHKVKYFLKTLELYLYTSTSIQRDPPP